MRILFLLDFFSTLGGVEFYNYQLIKGLTEQGIDVKVYIGERPKYMYWIEMLKQLNIEYHYPEIFHEDLQVRLIEIDFLKYYLQEIGKWKPDVIYAHPAGKLLITYFEHHPIVNVPIVSTEYTTPTKEASFWFCPELSQYINRINIMIATCESVAHGLKNFHHYKNQIEIIPHFIPFTDGWNEEDGELYSVGCICRLSPEKGADFLLGAWKNISSYFHKATLHIYGHGIDETHLKTLSSALGISDSVFFEGVYLPVTGIDEIAKKHRIFVQPSLFESIPTTILELLARKRTIVATNVGGVPEIINGKDRTGILVEAASTEEISKAILFIFNNPSYATMLSANGYEKFKRLYDFKSNMSKISNLFNSLKKRTK